MKQAQIVIATSAPSSLAFDLETVNLMKRGVITFDLTADPGRLFPSMPLVDLANARPADNSLAGRRVCYVNAGSAVPRTAAMALSNTFITMLDTIVVCEGLTNALTLTPGLRRGVFTFLGKVTDPQVARIAQCRVTDLNIFLQLS